MRLTPSLLHFALTSGKYGLRSAILEQLFERLAKARGLEVFPGEGRIN
jgi:hypothetical protein